VSQGGATFPRWVLWTAGLLVVGGLVFLLRGVLTPVFFALLIAYMLDPVVDRFEAMKLPRAAGIVIVLTLALGAIALFVVLVVPAVVRDAAAFARELPAKVNAWVTEWEPWLVERGIPVPHTLGEVIDTLDLDTGKVASSAAGPVGAVLSWLAGGTASLLGVVASLFLVPVLSFYLLYDFDRMTAAIRDLVPHRVRPFVVDVAREADEVLGQFIRGQLIVMVILAVLYAVGYSIAGVRLAVVIGLVAGLVAFIPYVGGATALLLALLMCFLDFQGWGQIAWVLVVYGIVQVLEGFVITPKIVGDKVGLGAIWVLLALMVGGELFGFLGVLLALPAAAVGKIFVVRALAWYRKSSFYLRGAPEPAEVTEPFLAAVLHEEGLPDSEETERDKRTQLDEAPADLDAALRRLADEDEAVDGASERSEPEPEPPEQKEPTP
jgi:predicted PurR-regulated permease PerM